MKSYTQNRTQENETNLKIVMNNQKYKKCDAIKYKFAVLKIQVLNSRKKKK